MFNYYSGFSSAELRCIISLCFLLNLVAHYCLSGDNCCKFWGNLFLWPVHSFYCSFFNVARAGSWCAEWRCIVSYCLLNSLYNLWNKWQKWSGMICDTMCWIYTHTCIHTCVCVHPYMCACVCIYMRPRTCVCTHTYTHIHIHTYICDKMS